MSVDSVAATNQKFNNIVLQHSHYTAVFELQKLVDYLIGEVIL